MKVKDLIKELQKFDPEKEVTITDGYVCNSYVGDWEIINFEKVVDIGIGGTLITGEDQ